MQPECYCSSQVKYQPECSKKDWGEFSEFYSSLSTKHPEGSKKGAQGGQKGRKNGVKMGRCEQPQFPLSRLFVLSNSPLFRLGMFAHLLLTSLCLTAQNCTAFFKSYPHATSAARACQLVRFFRTAAARPNRRRLLQTSEAIIGCGAI
jgi:hypothetical protein